MNITISGLDGSGKTTISKILAQKLSLVRVSTGEMFRGVAKEKKMSLMEFTDYSENHPEIDREIDERITRHGKKDDVILEGRLTGWVATKHNTLALKVWLSAPLFVRAKRIAQRDKKPYQATLEQLQKREKSEQERYRQLYGVDLNDLSIYSLIVFTKNLFPEEIVSRIVKRYKNYPPTLLSQLVKKV